MAVTTADKARIVSENQRAKGEDTAAKAMLRTAAEALVSYSTTEYTYAVYARDLLGKRSPRSALVSAVTPPAR